MFSRTSLKGTIFQCFLSWCEDISCTFDFRNSSLSGCCSARCRYMTSPMMVDTIRCSLFLFVILFRRLFFCYAAHRYSLSAFWGSSCSLLSNYLCVLITFFHIYSCIHPADLFMSPYFLSFDLSLHCWLGNILFATPSPRDHALCDLWGVFQLFKYIFVTYLVCVIYLAIWSIFLTDTALSPCVFIVSCTIKPKQDSPW